MTNPPRPPFIGSPWAPFGLRDDPFFQQPLDPAADAAYPVTLFVGRTRELQQVTNQILGASSSRAVVEGDAGVGKTSFVNRLKADLQGHQALLHRHPVRVHRGMTPHQFLAEVLKVLLQMHASLIASESSGAMGAVSRRVKDDVPLDAEGVFWRRIGRLIHGEDSIAGGVSVLGFGAERERIRIPAEVAHLSLFSELEDAVRYLSKHGARKVVVHVNNLENLSGDDATQAAALMQDLRDAFLVDYCHWLFVGITGIARHVFGASPQVRDIFPVTITLAPLATSDVQALLDVRYRHLQMGLRLTPPVAASDGARLYARYHGELRAFLRLMSQAVQQRSSSEPGVPLSAEAVVAEMAESYYASVLVPQVGAVVAAHLKAVYAGKPWTSLFRMTDLAGAAQITPASASAIVKRLLADGVIEVAERKGRSIYHRLVGGDWSVALNLA